MVPTIIFISHDLGTVERMCNRAILLRRGAIVAEGNARDVVTRYQRSIAEAEVAVPDTVEARDAAVAISGLRVCDVNGADRGVAQTGEPVTFELTLNVRRPMARAVCEVKLYAYDEGRLLFECRTPEEGVDLGAGDQIVRFDAAALNLLPGAYTLGAIVREPGATSAIDWWFGRTTLHVDTGPHTGGVFHVPYRWSVRPAARDERGEVVDPPLSGAGLSTR